MYVMFGLCTLPAGWLGDRIDRMILIAVFFIGCGLAGYGISFTNNPITMAIGLGVLGMFAAIYHPVGLAQVTLTGVRTGRALAINGVFGNMGLAGAAAITGAIVQFWNWQAAFVLPSTISILIGVLILFRDRGSLADLFCRTKDEKLKTTYKSLRQIQKTVFTVVCISALLGGFIFNIVTISLPKFLEERLMADINSLAWIGASAGLVFAVAAFAQLPVGEMLDRIGARPILLRLLFMQIILMLLLMQVSGWSALILILILVVLIFAQIPITTWLLGKYLDSRIRSRVVSVEYILSLGVGSTAVPLIAFLHENSIGFSYQFMGLALLAMVIFMAAKFLPDHK